MEWIGLIYPPPPDPVLVSVAFERYWMDFPAVGLGCPNARLLASVPRGEKEGKRESQGQGIDPETSSG